MSGRVGPADHVHWLALVVGRLCQGCAIVDALTRKLLDARRVKLARGDAAGDDQGPAAQLRAIAERDELVIPVDPYADDLLGQ